MGFLRGFLAILLGIILTPLLSILVFIVANGQAYVQSWETALLSMDFTSILQLFSQPINFDTTGTVVLATEGLGIPLMSTWAITGPGLIEAIGPTADLTLFVAVNAWKIIVWLCIGFFVGAIMSKAVNGLLMGLGIWIAWFVYNLLFAWIIVPIVGGLPMTLSQNILPFLMNAILPLVIVIVSGAIGGVVVKSEEF